MSKSTNALIAEMRRKYKTPEGVMRRLGIDEALLNEREDMADYTRDRGFSKSRRMGKDDEEEEQEEQEGRSPRDILADLMEAEDPDERMEALRAIREIAADRSGRWAKDHRERQAADAYRRARDPRRMGKDFGSESLTTGNTAGMLDDPRAHDMAMDATTGFDVRYPNVRNRYGARYY